MDAPPDDELAALILRRAGNETCTGPVELGIRFHHITGPRAFRKTTAPGPSVTFVAQGTKQVRFGGATLAYNRARYIVITGETWFDGEVVGATPARPYLAATLDLPVDVIVKTLLALPGAGAGAAPVPAEAEPVPAYLAPFDDTLRGAVIRLLRTLDEPEERRIVGPLIREELVYRLLRSDAAALVRASVQARDAGAIHEAMRFIRANAARALTVQAIARHVAMSPSHFAHRFRTVARVSPMRYLKQVRLDQARALLLARELRVTEIAARVGYESASHFSRDFKLAFGVAPAELVRRVRPAA